MRLLLRKRARICDERQPVTYDDKETGKQVRDKKKIFRKRTVERGVRAKLVPFTEEQADAIMLCVTNDFMTGITIDVDGGVLARI